MQTQLRSLLERVEREKQNPELEFELRFGKCHQQRFLPDLTLEHFQSLQLLFSDFATYSCRELPEETVTLFPNNIRRFQDGSYQKKEKIETVDQPFTGDMTLRFSFAKEYEVKDCKEKSHSTRTRKRWVYWPLLYSYDSTPYEYNLTQVNGTIHELEIEYHLQNVVDIKAAVEESVVPVKGVFSYKSPRVSRNVDVTWSPSLSSSDLLSRMDLRPRHPVNFPNPVLTSCKPPYWPSFTITNKLNGEYVMLIGEYHQSTLVNLFATTDQSAILVYSSSSESSESSKSPKTNSPITFSYSLWEAERFQDTYHIFDMFLDHDTDISHLPHATRVLKAREALREVRKNIHVKSFHPVHEIADRLKEWGNGDNDGIIFTPTGSARSVWPPIYKWKFYEELTIDMCMIEDKPGNFHLKVWSTAQALVEWKGTHRFSLRYPLTYRDHTGKVKNGDIWEVRYDFQTQRTVLGKPRPDKKRPNIKYVAENVWNDMAVPITEEILIEWITSPSVAVHPTVFFDKFVTNWLMQVKHPFDVHIIRSNCGTSSTYLHQQQFPTFQVLFTKCNQRVHQSEHKLSVQIQHRLTLRRDIQGWIAQKIGIDTNLVALSELQHVKHVLSHVDISKLVQIDTNSSPLSSIDWSHAEVYPFMGEIQILVNIDCGLWMYNPNLDLLRKIDETPSRQLVVALVQEFDRDLYSVLYGVVVYPGGGGNGELTADHLQRFIDSHACLTHSPRPAEERTSDVLKSVGDTNHIMVKTPNYNSSSCRHHIHIFPANEVNNILDQVQTRLSSAYVRHHNSKKRRLIDTYCRHATVIDVGIGAGGDLGKYRDAQTSTILGIEPNAENYLKLMGRLVQSYQNMMGRVFVNTDRAEVVDFGKWLQSHTMHRYAMATNVPGFPSGALHPERLKTNIVGDYSMTRRGDAEAICDEVLSLLGKSVSGWVVMDGTANMGGDTLQFSKYFAHVHAVEIDRKNARVLKENVEAFGCRNVTIHEADFLQVWPRYKHQVDVVYLDPPWGGPQYKEKVSLTLVLSQTTLADVIRQVMEDSESPKYLLLKLPNNCDLLVTDDGKACLKPYDYNVVSIRGAFTVVAIRNREHVEPRFKAVDTVTSFFSLSFFFLRTVEETYPDMDALLRSIISSLRPGGHFVVTTVDGDRLLTRLDDHDGEYLFKKSSFYRYHGVDIEVSLPGSIVGEHQVESLVDVGYMSRWLTQRHFEVVEDSYFDDHPPDTFRCFEQDEIELNQLYRTVVYRAPFEFCVYLSRESKESQESGVSIQVKDTVNLKIFHTWRGTIEHPIESVNVNVNANTFEHNSLARLHYNQACKQFVVVEWLTEENHVFSLEQMNRLWNKMFK